MTDDLLSTRACARLLGITVRRTEALCHDGTLPALRWGNWWVVRRADLEAYQRTRRPRGRPRRTEPTRSLPVDTVR